VIASYQLASLDPASGRWQQGPSPDQSVQFPFSKVVWTGKELIAWPTPPQRTTWQGEAYDPKRKRWSRLPAPPEHSRPAIPDVVLAEDSLFVLGGLPGGAPGASERLVAAQFDLRTRAWRSLPDPLPEPLSSESNLASHTSLWTGSDLLVHVGDLASGTSPSGVLLAYDPVRNTWRRVGDTERTALTPVAIADGRVLLTDDGGRYYLSEPRWRPRRAS
jgi:hypothetical protein